MPSPITTPGYRYATLRVPGDGTTTQFEFNFAGGYLDKQHVKVFIQDEDRVQTEVPYGDLVFPGPNQVVIPVATPIGSITIVRRETPKEAPLVDFIDGGILNEQNLNTTTEQAVFSCAEMVDLFADLLDIFYGGINDDLNGALEDIVNIYELITELTNLINDLTDRLDNLKFTDLVDTPNSYVGQANKLSAVNDTEDGIVFKTLAEVIADEGIDVGGIDDAPNDRKKYVRGSNKFGPLEPNEWTLFNLRESEDFIVGGKPRFSTLATGVLDKVTEIPVATAFNICGEPTRSGAGPYNYSIYIQRGYLNIAGTPTLCPTNNVGFYGTTNDYSYILASEAATGSYATLAEMMNKTLYIGISKTTGESIFTETELSTDDYYVLYKVKSMASQAFLAEFIDMRLLNAAEGGGGSVDEESITRLEALTGYVKGFANSPTLPETEGDIYIVDDTPVDEFSLLTPNFLAIYKNGVWQEFEAPDHHRILIHYGGGGVYEDDEYIYKSGIWENNANLQSNRDVRSITAGFDGDGSVLTPGASVLVQIPYSFYSHRLYMLADQTGDCEIEVEYCDYTGYPTFTSVTGIEKPAIIAGIKADFIIGGGFTDAAFTPDTFENLDIFKISIVSCTDITRLNVCIQGYSNLPEIN